MKDNLIRFDWAMKRLLRDKSNYVVLEGFLSTLLGEDLRICRFLESESNQEDATDKVQPCRHPRGGHAGAASHRRGAEQPGT